MLASITQKVDRGVLFMLLSTLFSAVNGAVAKVLAEDLSALEIVFFRNIIGVTLILVMLAYRPPKLSGGHLGFLILRGFLGFSAMILFFYTITAIPLGEAITLNKTSPLFVSIIAFFLLKERLSYLGVAALFMGFAGVVMITKPSGIMMSYEHFLGVLGGFFAAAAYATIRRIKDLYDPRVIVLSFMGMGTVVPILLFMLASVYTPPEALSFLISDFVLPDTPKVWLFIALMAVIATISQWLLTKAYTTTHAGIIGIVSYTNIPFAIGFGVMLGDMFPDLLALMGIGLIIAGGLLVRKAK
ncbi:MAG: DMT family transporter [Campylobacterota bacterium]|nr:DMT family transporter [Campylobacterota bacterium]